jgi:DAACS family dicarboxylate/amino acid:cation (Na+ or H+) symporter
MRKMPLHTKIFIGMLIGSIAGGVAQAVYGLSNPNLTWWVKEITQPVGNIFLRLTLLVVMPLLFSALVLGVADVGDLKQLGRMGMKALGLTVVLSGIAVALAVAGVAIVQPGKGISEERRHELTALYGDEKAAETAVEKAKEGKGFGETVLDFVPENPVEEAAKPSFGGALPVKTFLEGIFAVSLRLIDMAMKLAPVGVAALMFGTAAKLGVEAFTALGKYAGLVLVVLAVHLIITYSIALVVVAKRNPLEFFRQIREVVLTAFGTSSSNATLPTALRVGEEEVGIPREINSFVLTVGATANQNGTALFEGITVLFLAQVFGVALALPDQLAVIGLCILAGVGTAGVPGGSWPMIAAICGTVGVPPTAIALTRGIDRILDMSRTVVNVVGDMTIAACVAGPKRSQPEL